MAIVIQPYRQEHESAVGEFNDRLQRWSGDPNLVFSETAVPRWLPPRTNSAVWNEYFVAVEGSTVRGAYALKHEQVFVRGKGILRVACYHHPLSEGIIDPSYASIGGLLIRDALARQPLLYALGMGGYERPLAKMLKVLGFSLTLIPFYFRIVHPARFLRHMQALRQARWRAILMDIAAATGTGWLAIRARQAAWALHGRSHSFDAQEISEFPGWADDLWNEGTEYVSMAALRDANTLRVLYPPDLHKTRCMLVSRGDAPMGWAVVGQRRGDPKFGELRVGSIVDCWARPQEAVSVAKAAAEALEQESVDLIVSNQSHQVWCRALEKLGFLKGPSNFIFAASKKLTQLLQPLEQNRASFHITRADGDGLPSNF